MDLSGRVGRVVDSQGRDMSQIQVRFNTEKEERNKNLPAWKIRVDGIEHLAEDVKIEVPAWTTEDVLPDGELKWHMSCEGVAVWNESHTACVVR